MVDTGTKCRPFSSHKLIMLYVAGPIAIRYFNSLAPGRFGVNFEYVILKLISVIDG